jgi:hypothetical protein
MRKYIVYEGLEIQKKYAEYADLSYQDRMFVSLPGAESDPKKIIGEVTRLFIDGGSVKVDIKIYDSSLKRLNTSCEVVELLTPYISAKKLDSEQFLITNLYLGTGNTDETILSLYNQLEEEL